MKLTPLVLALLLGATLTTPVAAESTSSADAGRSVGEAAGSISKTAQEAYHSGKKAAKEAGKDVAKAAKQIYEETRDAANSFGKGVKDGFKQGSEKE